MSANDVKVNINVSDNGTTNKAIKSAETLKKTYDAAASSASKAAQAGGTQGSRAMASSVKEYGAMRASGSGTGASARDFANQAQGLGGLVRLYATYAANVFAVGAAFRALREASGTEIITRGLETMGVAGGKSLTNLSRQIVTLTDGAVSLREAMTSVAQASSAGLGSKQIQDLATVANKASNALGINMSDALNRLSRGITKIEPELLDEVGIFVRVDKAVQDYAQSVGKSVNSLSDFERRQAFANAVLEQGKKKFEDIGQVSNPYDKLLASVTNLGTEGLNLVNKVLEPITRILAESPTALFTAFALIGATIIKQALPAFGQWRAGLHKSAESAKDAAESIAKSFGDDWQSKLENRFKIPGLEKSLKEASEKVKALESKTASTIAVPKSIKPEQADSEQTIAQLDKLINKRQQYLETGMKGTRELTANERASAQEQLSFYEQKKKKAQELAELEKARYQETKFQQEVQAARDRAQQVADIKPGMFDPESIAQKQYVNALQKYEKMQAVATAADTARVLGVRQAWGQLKDTIEEKGIKGIDKFSTLSKGGLAAVGARIGGIISAFSSLSFYVAGAIAIFTTFDAILSKTAKQQQEFDTATSNTNTTLEQAEKTIKLYTTSADRAFTLEAITAYSNSISGIADSLDAQARALDTFNKAVINSPWDKLKDWIFSAVNKSNLDEFKSSVAKSIKDISKLVSSSGSSSAGLLNISKILGVDDLDNIDKVRNALNNLGTVDLQKIPAQLKDIAKESQSTTNSVVAFKESLKEIGKIQNQIVQATNFTDLQGKLGVELVAAAGKLATALEDPLKAAEALREIGKDPALRTAFGSDAQINALSIKVDEKLKQLAAAQVSVANLTSDLYEAQISISQSANAMGDLGVDSLFAERINSISVAADVAADKFSQAQSELRALSGEMAQVITNISEQGLQKVKLALKFAQEAAIIRVQQSQVSLGQELGISTAKRNYELTLDSIKIQESLISANFQQAEAQIENTRQVELLTAEIAKQNAQKVLDEKGSGKYTQSEIDAAERARNQADSTIRVMQAVKGSSATGLTDAAEQARFQAEKDKEKILSQQKQAALAAVIADEQIAFIKYTSDQEKERLSTINKVVESTRKELDIKEQALRLDRELVGGDTQSLITRQQEIDLAKIDLDYAQKLIKIDSDRTTTESLRKELGDDAVNRKLVELKLSEEQAEQDRISALTKMNSSALLARQSVVQKEFNKEQELANAKKQEEFQARQDILEVENQRLAILKEYGTLDQQELVRRQAFSEAGARDLAYDKEKYSLATENAKLSLELDQNLQRQRGTNDEEQKKALKEQETSLRTRLNYNTQSQAQLTAQKTKTDEILAQQTSWNLLTAKQADETKKVSDLANNLATAFGEAGQSIGEMVNSLVKANQQFEVLEKLKADRLISEEEYQKKSKLWALDTIASTSAAFKKQMSEKTTGFKILTGIEKAAAAASAITRMMDLKDTIMNAAAKVSANAPAIISQFLTQLGPIGWGLGIAAVAALGGAFSGGSAPGFTMSSEQRQQTQGTGSTYVDDGTRNGTGILVATGGGVFGDILAKSDSVAKTLERMEATDLHGVDQNQDMIKILKNLNISFDNVAKSLPSFQTSISGTQTGTVTDTGLLGFSFLGGSTTTTEIVSSGLELEGTFWDLVVSAKGLVSVFEDVKTTTVDSGFLGFGGGTDVKIERMFPELAQLSDKQLGTVTEMFRQGAQAIGMIGDKLGTTADEAITAMKAVKLSGTIDLKDKTSEEVAKELSNMMSSYLDDVVTELYPDLVSKFRELGEGAYETVSRVINTNENITQAIKNISVKTPDLSGLYDVSEALVNLAGGLDTFTKNYNFYFDNFLTDTDRLSISQTKVSKSLTELDKKYTGLNISTIKTKNGFKNLVSSLDLTKTADQELYTSLMELAPAFYEVADAFEKGIQATIDKFKNFGDSLKDFRDNLLLGSSSTLTPLEKYEESRRQFDTTYMSAISGDKDAQNKLSSVANSFLEASRTYNSSSSVYTQDFNEVLTKVNDAITYSEGQVTTAEQQLGEAQTQTSILTNIESAVTTTANALTTGITTAATTTAATSAATEAATTAATDAATTAATEAVSGYTSSYKPVELTEDQKKYFDFLDSSEGKMFKDIRGEALSNAVLPFLGAVTPGPLGLLASAAGYAFKDKDALSVFEADALAQTALDTGFSDKVANARAAGVDEGTIKEILGEVKGTMKENAKDTSFWGDLFGTGSGNKDAAKSTLGAAALKLETAGWKAFAPAWKEYAEKTQGNVEDAGEDVKTVAEEVVQNSEETTRTVVQESKETGLVAKDVITENGEAATQAMKDSTDGVQAKITEVGEGAVDAIKADSENISNAATDAIASNETMVGAVKDKAITTLDGINQKISEASAAATTAAAAVTSTASNGGGSGSGSGSGSRSDGDVGTSSNYYSGGSYGEGGYRYGPGTYTIGGFNPSTDAYADGGYATGLSIVGELGPELVDFNTPGRVYTAEETFGMFNGTSGISQDLVAEIRELRREVQYLREQQHEETGHLISATFEAQTQNADQVSEAVTSSTASQAWMSRVQNSVKLV